MEYLWLTLMLGGSLGILSIFLLILLSNLLTFRRLHATNSITRVNTTPSAPHRQSSWRLSGASARSDKAERPLWLSLVACLSIPLSQRLAPIVENRQGKQGTDDNHKGRSALSPRGRDAMNFDDAVPLISILVPARNEEANIEACIHSLLAQKYEPLEVLVLDDQSSDNTAAIVQRLIDELPATPKNCLRLLHGGELPAGWIGKNFACYQLAQQAQGEYLLFTDADTLHTSEMIPTILDYMKRQQIQLLTGQPEQLLGSIGERLIVPLLNFKILTLLPIALIRRRPEPSLATGNGQLLCFQRAAYEKMGGHMAVKGRILEDVLLARKMKATGYQIDFIDALELVRCRMYHSWHEVWAGFSKNLFAFYNYSLPFALLALILNCILFILPALILPISLIISIPQHIVLYALASYTLGVTMRILLTLRFTRTRRELMLLYSFLHPISILLECLILLNAIRWHYRKRGATWKGRQYS